ncbi:MULTISPECIES: aldo-keto reductase family protein [unclassified Pseudomonas]|jgi:hypothetical protein|uniref:hypothetical protein n=1 Tax=Pseudomonas sp. A-R-26 TaxID=2832404 RepID=UPI001CBBDBD5|nr:hypothetical protein [Pseudomonas sp. A-R-26]
MPSPNSFDTQHPDIYLGDRGFLQRYGSPYSNKEVESWARTVSQRSGLGLCSGDWVTAQAFSQALKDVTFRHLYHSRFLIKVIDKSSARLLSVSEVQQNPTHYYRSSQYEFLPDLEQIDADIEIINRFAPRLVSVGGDWLDILLAQGHTSLIEQIVRGLITRAVSGTQWLMLTFNLTDQCLWLLEHLRFDGVLTSVNLLQMDDVATLAHLQTIKHRWPLYALHCLAGGIIPLAPALDYALNHVGVRACIVGAGSAEHIAELIKFEASSGRYR